MRYLSILIVITYFVSVMMGWLQFELWGQVEYINKNIGNYSELLGYYELTNGHASRYLLVLPVYVLESLINIDKNYLFSIYIMLIVYILSMIYARLIQMVSSQSYNEAFLKSIIINVAISLLMNGRIVFALLAVNIVLWVIFRWYQNDSLKILPISLFSLLALWFSSVSSGAFSVIFMLLLLWVVWMIIVRPVIIHYLKKSDIVVSIGLLFSLILTYPLFSFYLEKNLDFYGGDLVSVLAHGMGGLFLDLSQNFMILPVLIVIFLSIMVMIFSVKCKASKPLLFVTIISMFGGMFGYSTLAIAFPSGLLILYLVVINASSDVLQKQTVVE